MENAPSASNEITRKGPNQLHPLQAIYIILMFEQNEESKKCINYLPNSSLSSCKTTINSCRTQVNPYKEVF